MNYRRIFLSFLLGLALAFGFTSDVNAYSINTPLCQNPIESPATVDTEKNLNPQINAKIQSINTDKTLESFSLQTVCLKGTKPEFTNIVVKDPELKAILKDFAKGDRVFVTYKQEKTQSKEEKKPNEADKGNESKLEEKFENILNNIIIETKDLNGIQPFLTLILSAFALWYVGELLLNEKKSWVDFFSPILKPILSIPLFAKFKKNDDPKVKGWLSLVTGFDKRYSNSKTQVTVWFFILFSSYIATTILRIKEGGFDFVGGVTIPQNLLILSGLSSFTFVTAKGITQSKVDEAEKNTRKPQKEDAKVPPSLANLFQDDDCNVDLGDFQMIIVTLLAVAVYIIQVISFLSTVELRHTVSLPDLDSTILSVFGLGQGAYLVKKAIAPLIPITDPAKPAITDLAKPAITDPTKPAITDPANPAVPPK